MKLWILLLPVLAVSCVLPSDLHELKIANLELRQGTITPEEFNSRVDEVESQAAARIDAVLEIAEKSLGLADVAGVGGGITTAAIIALNLWRNGTRRRDIKSAAMPPRTPS